MAEWRYRQHLDMDQGEVGQTEPTVGRRECLWASVALVSLVLSPSKSVSLRWETSDHCNVFISPRPDGHNGLFSCVKQKSMNRLRTEQNSAARTRTRRRDHITPGLASLHWPKSRFPKLCILVPFASAWLFSGPGWKQNRAFTVGGPEARTFTNLYWEASLDLIWVLMFLFAFFRLSLYAVLTHFNLIVFRFLGFIVNRFVTWILKNVL